jgi:hypothetical protein
MPTSPSLPPLANRRIVIALGRLDIGGAERQALLLARHRSQRQAAAPPPQSQDVEAF